MHGNMLRSPLPCRRPNREAPASISVAGWPPSEYAHMQPVVQSTREGEGGGGSSGRRSCTLQRTAPQTYHQACRCCRDRARRVRRRLRPRRGSDVIGVIDLRPTTSAYPSASQPAGELSSVLSTVRLCVSSVTRRVQVQGQASGATFKVKVRFYNSRFKVLIRMRD
jgi:hypothetical protein